MKYIIIILTLLIIIACCKEDIFNYTRVDNSGNIINGDTTQGRMFQDVKLDDLLTDSLGSIYLKIRTPKYRGCNNNVKVILYPNPITTKDKLYIKIQSSVPILSYALAYSGIKINGGYLAGNQKLVVNDISELKPINAKTTYEIYVATIDSCIYHGYYNLVSEQ